jgi:hypothetical protein
MEKLSEDMEQELYSTIIQTSYAFDAGSGHYSIRPITLGREMMLKPEIRAIEAMHASPAEDLQHLALKAATERKNEVLRALAIVTLDSRKELMDENAILSRMLDLDNDLDETEMAALLVIVLKEMGKVSRLMKATGIDRDREHLKAVHDAKKANKNTVTFGGVSIYGRLLDVACERYGWTLDYVLWGISSVNLQMMLADQVSSVFISDDELKNIEPDEE